MPYRMEAEAVLAMWRDVERQLGAAPSGSDEARRLTEEWARLRIEYRRLVELARLHNRPAPESWPEPASKAEPRARARDELNDLLTAWCTAEAALWKTEPGSAVRRAALDDARAARDAYQYIRAGRRIRARAAADVEG